MSSPPVLLTERGAAEACGLTLSHMHRLREEGRFPEPTVWHRGLPLWRADRVRTFRQAQRVPT